jgi:hypothetical protein
MRPIAHARAAESLKNCYLLLGALDEAGPHWVEMNVFHFLAGGILRP